MNESTSFLRETHGPDRRVYADGRRLRFRCFESTGRAPESLLNVSLIPCRPVAESYRVP
jgi:hypothetical protein